MNRKRVGSIWGLQRLVGMKYLVELVVSCLQVEAQLSSLCLVKLVTCLTKQKNHQKGQCFGSGSNADPDSQVTCDKKFRSTNFQFKV